MVARLTSFAAKINLQGLWNQRSLVLLGPTQPRRGKTVNMTTSQSKLNADSSDGSADCVSKLRSTHHCKCKKLHYLGS